MVASRNPETPEHCDACFTPLSCEAVNWCGQFSCRLDPTRPGSGRPEPDETAELEKAAGQFHDLRLHVANLVSRCGIAHDRWWQDPATQQPITRNVGELLMLCVSELGEGMEGHRKNLMDDKLPHFPMLTVELADCLIRIFDMAYHLKLDIAGALAEKMEYNMKRPDHTHAARLAPGGKKY